MENIINLYCSGMKKSKILKLSYNDIGIVDGDFLNIRISSKESLFNIPFDIFCIQKDRKLIFSPIKIPLESEELKITEDFRNELSNYLKYYFKNLFNKKMSKSEYSEFKFKHNLSIDKEANKYFAFYKKYMDRKLISIDNLTTDNSNIDNSNIEIYKGNSTRLLNDIIKLKPDRIFYATIMPILPIDVLLNLIRTTNYELDTELRIFLNYKAYKMYIKKYPKLSYTFLQNIIEMLRDTLNFELIDYFKDLSLFLIPNNNWFKLFKEIDDFNNEIDCNKYGLMISRNLTLKNDYDYEITISTGNKIYKENSLVFNIDNHKFVSDKFHLKSNTELFINYLIIENDNQIFEIPIYRKLTNETFLVDLDNFNNEDTLHLTKIVLEDKTVHVSYHFVYIKKEYNLDFEILIDKNYKIYKVNKKYKILYDKYKEETEDFNLFYLKKGEIGKLVYQISEFYLEEIELS